MIRESIHVDRRWPVAIARHYVRHAVYGASALAAGYL